MTTTLSGQATNVYIGDAGGELTVDIAVGATTLTVDKPYVFNEKGGKLELNDVAMTYLSADMETGVIVLSVASTVSGVIGDQVYVMPRGATKWALVFLDDEDEGARAMVPFSLYDRLKDGIREYDDEESVYISDSKGYWEVTGVEEEFPTIDAGLLDPDTLDNSGLTPLELFNITVALIEGDIAATNADVAAGDTALDQRIDSAIADFNAGLATKSKHTLSLNAPTVNDANNAGDVWERKNAGGLIIGRWRGGGGTTGAYVWTTMNLDATYIPVLDIGTGTFGDLSGTRLVAKSIGVDKLIVSDFTNYWPDRFINLSTAADGGFEANGTRVTGTSPPAGGEVARLNSRDHIGKASVAAKQGDYFYVEVTYKRVSGAAAFNPAIWTEKDASGTDTTASAPWTTGGTTVSDTSLGGGWYRRITNVGPVVAADTQFAKLWLQIDQAGVSGTVIDVTDIVFRRRFGGELIVDGSILARHVTADMVEGLLVTGRILQTNTAPNTGIKISTNGLIGYGTDNNPKTVISPTTGLISAVGTIQAGDGSGTWVRMLTSGSTGSLEFWAGGVTIPGKVTAEYLGPLPTVSLYAPTNPTYYTSGRILVSSQAGFGSVQISDVLNVKGSFSQSNSAGVTKLTIDENGALNTPGVIHGNNLVSDGDVTIPGSIVGMGRKTNKWDYGLKSGTTDGVGNILVSHQCGTADIAICTGADNAGRQYTVNAQGSGEFNVKVTNAAGANVASASVSFYWFALKAGV